MLYLSKGLLIGKEQNALLVSHCGTEHKLSGERADIWERGLHNLCETMDYSQEIALTVLSETNLAESSNEQSDETLFRLLVNCAICPKQSVRTFPLLNPAEKRICKWVNYAGLRLTIAELVYLEELKIKPAPNLLGAQNRQTLTEAIYTTETISDRLLESRMERSRYRDRTVKAVLSLLRKNKIFLN
jgi:hypothetical protein